MVFRDQIRFASGQRLGLHVYPINNYLGTPPRTSCKYKSSNSQICSLSVSDVLISPTGFSEFPSIYRCSFLTFFLTIFLTVFLQFFHSAIKRSATSVASWLVWCLAKNDICIGIGFFSNFSKLQSLSFPYSQKKTKKHVLRYRGCHWRGTFKGTSSVPLVMKHNNPTLFKLH